MEVVATTQRELTGIRPRYDVTTVIRIAWLVAKRCNYNCTYCADDVHDFKSAHLELEKMKRVADELFRQKPQGRRIHYSFTGGEPFYNPAFVPLVKHIGENKLAKSMSVTTNGTASAADYEAVAPHLVMLTFSYHFEHVRDRSIFLEKVVRYHAINERVVVNVMLLPGFFEEAREIGEFLSARGIKFNMCRIFPLPDEQFRQPRVKRRIFAQGEYYNEAEEAEMRRLIDTSQSNDVELEWSDGFKETVSEQDVSRRALNRFKDWSCNVGIERLAIGFGGDLYRGVCRMGGKLGNVYSEKGFKLPKEAVLCANDSCNCGAEINVTKFKQS